MAWPAVIAAGAAIAGPVIGGIMGNKAAKKDRAAAQAASAAAVAELRAIGLPPDLSKRIIMEEFVKQGVYTPTMEEDIDLGISQVSLIQEDASLRDAQLGALSDMRRAAATGFDAATEADLRAARQDVQEDVQGQLGAIEQQMAARGQAGSGQELIMKMGAAQQGERTASEESDRLIKMAAQQALEAISRSGQMAGDIRGQDFDVASAKAGAADAFTQAAWNAANARQQRNIAEQNVAQKMNLAEQQRIHEANVQRENQERQRMEQAKADYWDRRLAQAQGISSAMTGQQQMYSNLAQQRAKSGASMGSGIGQAGTAFLGAYGKNPGAFGGGTPTPVNDPITITGKTTG